MEKLEHFFCGERVAVVPKPVDGLQASFVIDPKVVGVVQRHEDRLSDEIPGRYMVLGDDGVTYALEDDGRLIDFRYVPEDDWHPGEWVAGTYVLQRLNIQELERGYTTAFRREVDLITPLAQQTQDTTKRAAVLATLRGLRAYLEGKNNERA